MKFLHQVGIQKGTRVVVRADFDVMVEGGRIREDFRMRAVVPTLQYLLDKKARIRIVSHLGRPGGKKKSALSMKSVAAHLAGILKHDVVFVSDFLSEKAFAMHNASNSILFFENIRFWQGEEKNDIQFAKSIARWGDVYVNEAFANSHRCHASMVALAKILPACAGFQTKKEIEHLSSVFNRPQSPLVAVLGGAKLETKLPLVQRFLKKGALVLVGGALSNTLLEQQGIEVGASLVEKDVAVNPALLKRYIKKIELPIDVRVGLKKSKQARIALVRDIKKSEYIKDIGPQTEKSFSEHMRGAGMIVWNGPLGLTEMQEFQEGTRKVAEAIARSGAVSIVGGGDTIAAIEVFGLTSRFTHVSTGGGAMLLFLAGEKLPALEALKERSKIK